MAINSDQDPSNRKYDEASKLFQAAQRAPKGSATRAGLYNAMDKKTAVADAMWHVEREQEMKQEGTK